MKKIVASLLSVIMLVFACGPVGLAYNFSDGVLTSGTTENDMPTLQAVYMKRNADAPGWYLQVRGRYYRKSKSW